jgi:putative ABC transport system permease protein
MIGSASSLTGPQDPGRELRVRLLHRTGGLEHLRKVEGSGGDGYWISESIARAVGAAPGESVTLHHGDGSFKMRVAGIYEDFGARPLSDFWSPLTFELISVAQNDPPLPPPIITTRERFFDVERGFIDQASYSWDFPLVDPDLRLEQAQRLLGEHQQFERDVRNPESELGGQFEGLNSFFGGPDVYSFFPEAVRNVEETVTSIKSPVNLLAITGRIVALAVFAAAGVFLVQRRRVEVRLLASQGVRASTQGIKAAVEAILPGVIGAAAGWGVAVALIRSVGPTEVVSPGVVGDALRAALLSVVLGLVLLGVVAAFSARRETEIGAARLRGLASKIPWEAVVLTLAAASYYEITTRRAAIVDTPDGPPEIDIFVLLFPILFIAGFAGVASRALQRTLPALRRLGDRTGPGLYLATRRLAGAPKIALLLVTASAISLGALVYSAVLVASNEATARAKANVQVGGESMVPISSDEPLDESLPFDATLVVRKDDTEVEPGGIKVDTLGVDPASFQDVAFFDASFAGESLEELVDRLRSFNGETLSAIVVGVDLQDGSVVATPTWDAPLEIVGTADTWPGMSSGRPMIVTRRDALFEAAEAAGSSIPERLIVARELWAEAPLDEVLSEIRKTNLIFNPSSALSTEEILSGPSFLALSWTFEYLQALGIATGFIALIGMLLYLQTRQQAREVSYALARRMGLRRGAHRWAIAVELGAMLGVSLVVGGLLAVVASLLVYGRLDPLPDVPPDPLFRIPPEVILVLVPAIVVAALVGAWRVQRKADTANVAEVLRYAQ